MSTITDLATDIGTFYLRRADMPTTLTKFILNFYRVLCQKIPFEGLQASATLALTQDVRSYDLASSLPDLQGIVAIRANFTTTNTVRLNRTNIQQLEQGLVSISGKPSRYARWGSVISLDPAPDSSTYTLGVRYWKKPTISNPTGNTTLVVPDAWLELIEWEAYYRSLLILNRSEEAMGLIMPNIQPKMPSPSKNIQREIGIIPRLWNELLSTIEEREFIDENFGINPVRHPLG